MLDQEQQHNWIEFTETFWLQVQQIRKKGSVKGQMAKWWEGSKFKEIKEWLAKREQWTFSPLSERCLDGIM